MTIFGEFTTGSGTDETKLLQTEYGYLALRAAWDIYAPTSIPLDVKMLLAIYYRGELGTDSNDNIRLEALARNFLAHV